LTNQAREGKAPLEPLLKWPGGKRRLLNYILPLIPKDFSRYFEPFFGSGAVFFALRPTNAVLSDKNSHLICMYNQIRDNPEAVIRQLKQFRNTEKAYYEIRSANPKAESAIAARLIYLSALSFNGIHRVNLRGLFNVPYGHKTYLNPCEPQKIFDASRALKHVEIKCQDFQTAVSGAHKNDVVYLDPPYTTAHTNNGFLKYNAKIFTWDDQKRLARIAYKLADRGCFVIVSNADHVSIRRLYRDFNVMNVARYSVIAASRQFRRPINECIFYNKAKKNAE
jgi:DNA adenine methylase